MSKRQKKKPRVDTSSSPEALASSPFAALGGLRDQLPEGDAGPHAPPGRTDEDPSPRRAVVRFQRKGRGGKEVTLVEKLEMTSDALDRWLKKLKGQLGCGGVREDHVLVLQGDQRQRLPALLEKLGVGKISIS